MNNLAQQLSDLKQSLHSPVPAPTAAAALAPQLQAQVEQLKQSVARYRRYFYLFLLVVVGFLFMYCRRRLSKECSRRIRPYLRPPRAEVPVPQTVVKQPEVVEEGKSVDQNFTPLPGIVQTA